MPQIQHSQVQLIKVGCRFEMTAADSPSNHEFCAFDFPGCKGCPEAHAVRTLTSSEDPMQSEVWHAWIARLSRRSSPATTEASNGRIHSPRELGPV
jgi:hypothetical protein